MNEGEWKSGGQKPGSISVIDLSGVVDPTSAGNLANYTVNTYDFSGGNLAAGVSLAGLRRNDLAASIEMNLEPEYLTEGNGKLYVSLQENNALGVFDLASRTWEKVHNLGYLTQTIDASDRDGGAFVNDVVKGMPMPDTIQTFQHAGKTYIVTANEGDARPDDGDVARIGSSTFSRANTDDATEAALDAIYGGNYRADGALGRLDASRVDGNTDADAQYEQLIMLGTRSISIWDAETGALVEDTGALDALLLSLDPAFHNMNQSPAERDNRSDNKGPEPEALVVFSAGGHDYVVAGMERQNGVVIWRRDGTDLTFVQYLNNYSVGDVGPESMLFISAADSPWGREMILVGNEISGTVSVLVVPEPATIAGLGAALLLAVALVRRRR